MEAISCLQFHIKVFSAFLSVPQTWKVFSAMPLPDSVKTILFASLMYVSQQLEINSLILLMHFMDF